MLSQKAGFLDIVCLWSVKEVGAKLNKEVCTKSIFIKWCQD